MPGSKLTGEVTIPDAVFSGLGKKVKNISSFRESVEGLLKEETTELLESLLGGGMLLGASDLHIEPESGSAKLRARVDGILQDVMPLDPKIYKSVLSRIKLLSGLKLNITDRPQDGRFSIILKDLTIEIRASTLPAEFGESIVLRILNPKNLIEIGALGLRKDLLETFQKEVKRPNGMIIVTGPTGSGKTTTLYAFLKKIQRPEIKVITIEDPIEYHLKGISQTQVVPEKGYDFAKGLRSIMRQDPDVVLVGEIRDLETAKIALQAALTGHLVLTTLHTNDAAGTVARLQALGEKSANIASGINIAIAQRLVRKVCKKCAILSVISPSLLIKIKKELKNLPKRTDVPSLKSSLKVAKGKGCKVCNSTGYKGRVGIFETFLIDEEMERFILTSPSTSALQKKAVKKGMVTMRQDGLIKVLQRVTTIEEVDRVSDE
ncbi:GspE/PulE family protein [Patescibacteria group bacterium]